MQQQVVEWVGCAPLGWSENLQPLVLMSIEWKWETGGAAPSSDQNLNYKSVNLRTQREVKWSGLLCVLLLCILRSGPRNGSSVSASFRVQTHKHVLVSSGSKATSFYSKYEAADFMKTITYEIKQCFTSCDNCVDRNKEIDLETMKGFKSKSKTTTSSRESTGLFRVQ